MRQVCTYGFISFMNSKFLQLGDSQSYCFSPFRALQHYENILVDQSKCTYYPNCFIIYFGQVAAEDSSGDEFEDVPEKEGLELVIPAELRQEYGLEPISHETSTSTLACTGASKGSKSF